MGGRDGIYTAMSGEMGYIQQWVERWDIYSNEWRDGIYTAMSGEMGYIQQWVERWDIYSNEWRDGIYKAMNERDLRMGEWNNRRQWNVEVGRRRQTFWNRAIYVCVCIYIQYILHRRPVPKWEHNVQWILLESKSVTLLPVHLAQHRVQWRHRSEYEGMKFFLLRSGNFLTTWTF
jgi:hypothetical protein